MRASSIWICRCRSRPNRPGRSATNRLRLAVAEIDTTVVKNACEAEINDHGVETGASTRHGGRPARLGEHYRRTRRIASVERHCLTKAARPQVRPVLFDVGQAVSASALTEHEAPAGGDVDEKICAAAIFGGSPLTLPELNGHLDERGVAAHSRPDVLAPAWNSPCASFSVVRRIRVLPSPGP
jgi:hypothetical protein